MRDLNSQVGLSENKWPHQAIGRGLLLIVLATHGLGLLPWHQANLSGREAQTATSSSSQTDPVGTGGGNH